MHFLTAARAICEGVKHQSRVNAVFLLKVLCRRIFARFWQSLKWEGGTRGDWTYRRYINIDEALMTNKLQQ